MLLVCKRASHTLTNAFVTRQEWEMFRVNNRGCDGAPLDLPDLARPPDPEEFTWN